MELAVLSSGSSGNSFYIGNHNKGILIDAGISSRQIIQRLDKLKIPAERIKGIFITHEHSDHTKGIDVFSRRFQVPVFATQKTADFLPGSVREARSFSEHPKVPNPTQELFEINIIENKDTIKLAGLEVESFSKSHKALDPVSFSISDGKKRAGIITDAGFCCNNILREIRDADFLCLESNHDLKMLEEGRYPYFLKNWIKSDTGHLSNIQAGLAVLEHAPSKLKQIILSHISKNNNTPELALKTFKSLIKERKDLKPKILAPEHGAMTGIFKI